MGTRGEIRVAGGRGRKAWVNLHNSAHEQEARRAVSKVNGWLGRQCERPTNFHLAEKISKAFGSSRSNASRMKPFETGSEDERIWREYAFHARVIRREDGDGWRFVFTQTYPRE
jgi:hypothetical protein